MPTDTPTKRRPRFSLLSLLLVTAVVAQAFVIFRLAPLYWEVRELRRQAGILEIGDKHLVHATGVETYQQQAWKWRVWRPAGKRVFVQVATSRIPLQLGFKGSEGVPPAAGGLELGQRQTGGVEVEVSLAPERQLDGAVRWNLHHNGVTQYLPVPADASDWLLKGCRGHSGGGTMAWTAVERPREPMQLLWLRPFYAKAPAPPLNQPGATDGVMAWIEVEDAE